MDACRGATGVTRHALAQRAALEQRPDVELLALTGRITDETGRDEWRSWTAIPRRSLPLRTRDMLRFWRVAGIPTVDAWTGEVDWIYCPAEYLVAAARPRVAVTSHDILQDLTFGGPRRRALLRHVFRRADLVLSVSRFNSERLMEAFPECEGKVALVPNAPDDLFFEAPSAEEREQVRPRLGLPHEIPYLLSVANFQPRKNLTRLIRAAGRLSEVASGELALVLVGVGSPEETRVIEEAVDSLGAGPRIVMPGYLSGKRLRALYAEASALVFASTCESFGIPAAEAMAQDCPLALAGSTALPEVAGSAGWYFDPLDEEALTATLRALLDDQRRRQERVLLGRVRVQSFRWSDSCDRLIRGLRAAG
jgi:alpha-1,3-rhamnosyl/mannosyltransferase